MFCGGAGALGRIVSGVARRLTTFKGLHDYLKPPPWWYKLSQTTILQVETLKPASLSPKPL